MLIGIKPNARRDPKLGTKTACEVGPGGFRQRPPGLPPCHLGRRSPRQRRPFFMLVAKLCAAVAWIAGIAGIATLPCWKASLGERLIGNPNPFLGVVPECWYSA